MKPNNSPIRVIHFLKNSTYSGAENVVCQIMELYKNNSNVEMYYCSPSGDIENILRDKKLNFIPMKDASISEIGRVIKEYKPNIIQAHDPGMTVKCVFATKDNCKIVSHIHGNHPYMRKIGIQSLMFQMSTWKVKKIIWVSNSTYNQYFAKKHVENKSVILPNIIDLSQLGVSDPLANKDYDILFLGRMTEAKNPIRFIKLCQEVVKRRPDTKVIILGDGELRESVEEEIKELSLEKNISMKGFVNNPSDYLNQSKMVVMTSTHEGTPMAALEALSMSVPIISTPTDGMVDLLINGKTGYLSDNDQELVEMILKLCDDEKLRDSFGRAARRDMEVKMDVNLYRQQIERIYSESL